MFIQHSKFMAQKFFDIAPNTKPWILYLKHYHSGFIGENGEIFPGRRQRGMMNFQAKDTLWLARDACLEWPLLR